MKTECEQCGAGGAQEWTDYGESVGVLCADCAAALAHGLDMAERLHPIR